MSVKILDVPGPIVLNIWNEDILKDCAYPNKLKLADVSSLLERKSLISQKL